MAIPLNLNWLRLNVCLMEPLAGRNYLYASSPAASFSLARRSMAAKADGFAFALCPSLTKAGGSRPLYCQTPVRSRAQTDMIHQRAG